MDHTVSKELAQFLEASPSCFHAVENMKKSLLNENFVQLQENQKWHVQPGGRYFITRNGSSLIAFTVPEHEFQGMRIIASHGDSPTFK